MALPRERDGQEPDLSSESSYPPSVPVRWTLKIYHSAKYTGSYLLALFTGNLSHPPNRRADIELHFISFATNQRKPAHRYKLNSILVIHYDTLSQ